jgi:hypothetical protein
LFQRLSVAVQRGNAAAVLGTLPSNANSSRRQNDEEEVDTILEIETSMKNKDNAPGESQSLSELPNDYSRTVVSGGDSLSSSSSFTSWLSSKLLTLNKDFDLDVSVSCIEEILGDDNPEDEKRESIAKILGEILVCDSVEDHCNEITKK